MSKPEEPAKPSLGHDVAQAARESRDWLADLFQHPGDATRQLREGLRSETFQQRMHRWKNKATLKLGRISCNLPLLVGISVATYSALSQSSLIGALSFGLAAGVLTHFAFLVLPFALLGATVVLLFLGLRAVALGLIPGPPDSDGVVVAKEKDKEPPLQTSNDTSTVTQTPEPTPTPPPVPTPTPDDIPGTDVKPNGIMLKRVNGEDRSLLERILVGGLFKLTDPKDLEVVRRWIETLRDTRTRFTELQEASTKLASLSSIMDQAGLFELGLLHSSSFSEKPLAREEMTEQEWQNAFQQALQDMQADVLQYTGTTAIIEVYSDGSSDADQFDESGEPEQRPGQQKLISPLNHGYVFIDAGDLNRLKPPDLVCRVVQGIVVAYVKATGDKDMINSWRVISRAGPNSQGTLLTSLPSPGFNLAALEEDVLAGEVDDASSRKLATAYSRYQAAIEEFEDYITHQQRVAKLTTATLKKALEQIHATEAKERSARIAARRDPASPHSNPYRAGGGDGTPLKTREQRRAEIAAVVRAAVPTQKGDW